MATRNDLVDWIYGVLSENGGPMRIARVAEVIWAKYESELKTSGDLFYTWQYDMRWAALKLRKAGKLKNVEGRGTWIAL